LVNLLKDKLPSGQKRLTVCLVDEKPERSIDFSEEMRRRLNLADDKLIISYRDENGEIYISHSIERVIKIERDI